MVNRKKSVSKIVTKPKSPKTIEEKEIDFRAERAQQTRFRITVLDEVHFPFTDYETVGDTNVRYTVEIRSLSDKINSCNCPDHRVNMLGTCKHIEGTLNFIRAQGKRKFKAHAELGSSRAEIFLHPKTKEACIQWPQQEVHLDEVRSLLSPYASTGQTQLVNPVMGVATLDHTLRGASQEVVSKIRLSQHLVDWTARLQQIQDSEDDRKQFLADVEAGKRSLQMLSCNLLPYQEEGMLHLAFQRRAILADEMGLGKTIQAIAACELLRRLNGTRRVLVVTPASLKGEWEEQIARFSGLPTLIVRGSRADRLMAYKQDSFFYLVNYEQVRSDHDEIQALMAPDVIVLDEAQRIKNWPSKTSWAVKQVKTSYAFVLTGTPIENRIDEIYSIMQVVDPYILGPLYKFQQDFYQFDERQKPVGYKNLDELHRKLKPVVLRRRKKDVEEQLPERTINNFLVTMDPEQALRYKAYSDQTARLLAILKKRPLNLEEQKKLQRLLACMRMVADTPYILDEECRECPKLRELEEILLEFTLDQDNKLIIFSEWERMLFLVRELVEGLGIDYAWHSGSVSQDQRRQDIKRFKEDPNCRIFLTTDSGSTGLNLQVANVVINLDLPWNPAKLEQRIARAWRKNQVRRVQVINLITENTIEHRMLSMLAQKQAVADVVLDALGDSTEMPLPSASQHAFVDQLEQLIVPQYQITARKKEDKPSPEQLKQNILARHSDRIQLLEIRNESVLAVVDKIDPEIRASLSEAVQGAVEVLDLDTFTALRRLVTAGLIQFGTDKQVLFQSDLLQTSQRNHHGQKLEQATALYKETERKLKMISLLKTGGFIAEALPYAREIFHKGVDVLKILDQALDPKALQIREWLENEQSPEILVGHITSWMEELSATLAEFSLGITFSQRELDG